MFQSITSIFKQLLEGNDLSDTELNNPELAMAALLCEVASADNKLDERESEVKITLLQQLTGLDLHQAKALIHQAQEKVKHSVSLYDFTSHLRELEQEARFELVKAMWEVAHADGHIDPMEDAIIRKVAELLYVDHSEFIRAKLNVLDR